MEKRKRYTYQVKTEVSQSAAYFIDQIVEKSHGYYRSRSDFVREALLIKIIEIEPVVEDYLSKEEIKRLNRVGDRFLHISPIEIPSTDITNNKQPMGNGKRKRYTVQVRTEISEAPYLYIDLISEKYDHYELSFKKFLRRVVIKAIIQNVPFALEYLSEKERLEYEKYKDFKI